MTHEVHTVDVNAPSPLMKVVLDHMTYPISRGRYIVVAPVGCHPSGLEGRGAHQERQRLPDCHA
jgi:hypothetical protein